MLSLNVMIVDDEPHIRAGIKMKVNWKSLGMRIAGEASDGKEALREMQKCEIDIVITDINMPTMDGLEFIQKAMEIDDRVKFIIISGYSEFEYARSAMKLGVTEYLLKPIKEIELQASLFNLKEKLMVYPTKRENTFKEIKTQREESLLQLLTDKNTKTTFVDLTRVLGVKIISNRIVIGMIKIDSYHSTKDSIDRNPPLIQYHDIERVISEAFAPAISGHIIKCVWPEHEFMLLLQVSNWEKNHLQLMRSLNDFLTELEKQYGIKATIGLSKINDIEESVIISYHEALFALKERIMRGTGKIVDYPSITINKEKPNFQKETRLLIRLLKERRWDQVRGSIEVLMNQAINKGAIVNHTHLNELFIEMYLAIKNFASEESDLTENYTHGENIANIANSFANKEQLVEWLYSYAIFNCRNSVESIDASGKEIVQWVQNYIKEFYSSDITLAKVSEKYHINPIYFSRIFKLYVGESFNNYITKIRMEEAKSLMESTSLKIQDISEIVGYEDPKYFSKVFKKYFGISPSFYNEKREFLRSED